ncbi:hypothetical protein [Streptomyces sp. 8N706]|uniref:hypothetical protein n=1 Tax=Streptomyces sp. 8N706 TaxID=3457416 RepID=UPI003FD0C6D4
MTDQTMPGARTVAASPKAEPITADELKQARDAWRRMRSSAVLGSGLRPGTSALARGVFELGWAACARMGHGAPALADVPIPSQDIAGALHAVSGTIERAGVRIGQEVDYYGSQFHLHGRYYVTAVEETADARGYVTTRYALSEWSGGRFRRVLSGVHSASMTPLASFWEMRPAQV